MAGSLFHLLKLVVVTNWSKYLTSRYHWYCTSGGFVQVHPISLCDKRPVTLVIDELTSQPGVFKATSGQRRIVTSKHRTRLYFLFSNNLVWASGENWPPIPGTILNVIFTWLVSKNTVWSLVWTEVPFTDPRSYLFFNVIFFNLNYRSFEFKFSLNVKF